MDCYIDPAKQDYVLASGSPVRDPLAGLANAAYFRLTIPLGSYWADPAIGSRLHELQREKDLARVAVLAKQYAENALRPLIDDGRAKSVSIDVIRLKDASGAGRHQLNIELVATSGEVQSFQFPLKVI